MSPVNNTTCVDFDSVTSMLWALNDKRLAIGRNANAFLTNHRVRFVIVMVMSC